MSRKKELQEKLYSMTTQMHDNDEYQQSIWMAIADALEPIDKTVKETVDGIFVDKSTWELDFWEDLFGLEADGTEEQRKSAVKSQLRMNPTMTTEVFKNIVSSWKGAEIEVEEFYDEYRIEVRFVDPNETPDDMDALVEFMYEILPAHLAMSVGYKYLRIKDVHHKLTHDQMDRLSMSSFQVPEGEGLDGGYYTDRLNLYNRDPIDDADRLFDLQAMINDNWQKIDEQVEKVTDSDKKISDLKEYTDNKIDDATNEQGEELSEHISDENNPHNVTKEQIGLDKVINSRQATKAEFDEHKNVIGNYQTSGHLKLSNSTNSQSSVSDGVAATPKAVKDAYDHAGDAHTKIEKHEGDKNNPHNVTKAQVGLGNVANYSTATRSEAEAGTVTNKYMTPKTTADAIKKQAGDAVKGHTEDYNNPHKVTKEQIGLGNVDNVKQATKAEFDRHVERIGDFGREGHVKLSNHTTSESSVSDGVAATPYAVKKVNDRIDNLTIGDLTTDSYMPPSAPPRDYPLGITSFRTNASMSKEWQELVGDGIVNTRTLVVTYKADNTWQATQTIYLIDGYANTGNTIQHRAMYVRSAMASNQSDTNQWSEPVKVLSAKDLSDSTTSNSSETIATSRAVKQAYDRADEAFQLGVKQKKATADSLTSIGASLPSDPTWDELQEIIKKDAKVISKAEIVAEKGQTIIKGVGFKPDITLASTYSTNSRLGVEYNKFSPVLITDEGDLILGEYTDDGAVFKKPIPVRTQLIFLKGVF